MRITRCWLLLCTLLTTVQTGCILLYSGDSEAGGNGGSNAAVTSTGGLSAGGGGAGGASSSSSSSGGGGAGGINAGGGGAGGQGPCTEEGAANCGPGSTCAADGYCTVVASAPAVGPPFKQVLFVGGDNGGYAVGYSARAVGGSHSLRAWPLGFTQNADPLEGTATLTDPGVGFIAAGGANHFYYFGQLQTCDGEGAPDSCVTVCPITSDAMPCQAAEPLTNGGHVNGAVMVRGATPMEDQVYFAEADDASNGLLRVSRDCLEGQGAPCGVEIATEFSAPTALDPLGMDRDPVDGSVWWNTWGGSGLTGGCVYSYPGDDLSQCLQTVPTIAHPNRLALSANSVFVGTFSTAGEDGPIQRLGRCAVGGLHPVTEFSSVTWPADADGLFLYATSLSAANELRVLNANTGQLVKSLLAQTAITSIDASHPDFLFYAAGDRIYRWRKPPAPCPSAPGPAVCGDGCVDLGEDCDDGNSVDNDGCNDACDCQIPQ